MATTLLEAHDHYCFHSPICNVHQHPDLHHCHQQYCPAAIGPEIAAKAGLMDDDGEVSCPSCGGPTTVNPGKRIAEVHAKLCTDETIHYPDMHRAGKLDSAKYAAWKATLTREELMGHYRRTPDVHVTVQFTHEETTLMDTDLPAFNTLLQQRLKERSEVALLHQSPHRHKTTTHHVDLKPARKT